MDFYSLINCIPVNTNCFTQKYGYFQNHSDIFLLLKHNIKLIKTSGKMLVVDRIMTIFIWSKNFWAILAQPPKKISPLCLYTSVQKSTNKKISLERLKAKFVTFGFHKLKERFLQNHLGEANFSVKKVFSFKLNVNSFCLLLKSLP